MAHREIPAAPRGRPVDGAAAERTRLGVFAGGGALGAIVMSSCCILPLVLFGLGVTGAWIGNLAALALYKPYFFVATAGFLAAGFWSVYRRPATDCDDAICARPVSDRILRAVLWSATGLVIAAAAFPYAAPLFLDI